MYNSLYHFNSIRSCFLYVSRVVEHRRQKERERKKAKSAYIKYVFSLFPFFSVTPAKVCEGHQRTCRLVCELRNIFWQVALLLLSASLLSPVSLFTQHWVTGIVLFGSPCLQLNSPRCKAIAHVLMALLNSHLNCEQDIGMRLNKCSGILEVTDLGTLPGNSLYVTIQVKTKITHE